MYQNTFIISTRLISQWHGTWKTCWCKCVLYDVPHRSVWTSQAHLHSSASQRSPDVWKQQLTHQMNSESNLKSEDVKVQIHMLPWSVAYFLVPWLGVASTFRCTSCTCPGWYCHGSVVCQWPAECPTSETHSANGHGTPDWSENTHMQYTASSYNEIITFIFQVDHSEGRAGKKNAECAKTNWRKLEKWLQAKPRTGQYNQMNGMEKFTTRWDILQALHKKSNLHL